MFVNKYKNLYNSVPYNIKDMNHLTNHICDLVDQKCCSNKCYNSHIINVSDVNAAIKQLKSGKGDGNSSHMSDHVINGIRTANENLYRVPNVTNYDRRIVTVPVNTNVDLINTNGPLITCSSFILT